MTKRKGILGWLYRHGIVLAYGVIISFVLAISAVTMMAVVLFAHWWDSVR